jgi:hypothetical protein
MCRCQHWLRNNLCGPLERAKADSNERLATFLLFDGHRHDDGRNDLVSQRPLHHYYPTLRAAAMPLAIDKNSPQFSHLAPVSPGVAPAQERPRLLTEHIKRDHKPVEEEEAPQWRVPSVSREAAL